MTEVAALNSEDVVLVTGGTGFTGVVLVKLLCEAGCQVRVLARASSNREALAGLPVEWITGDVFDPAAIQQAAAGVHYVFHVAAAYREAKIADDVYHKVHVVSTQLLAEAVVDQPQFKRFVHVSTVGVLGHIENPPADETTAYSPGDVYQDTKTEAEKWILNFARERGLAMTVVRPAAIYGPGDRRLLKVFKMARLPVVPVIGFTKGLYHLIHVEDLARFMMVAAVTPATKGEIYICGNPEAVSIREIIAIIAGHLCLKPKFIRVPASPFFALGLLCEVICKPLGIEPPIYRRRVAFFTKDRSFNTAKMRRDTAFEYRYTNRSGLEATADWYRQHDWF